MIHHQYTRQAFEHRLTLGKFPPIHLELNMPAEIVHPCCHLFQNIPRYGTPGEHMKSHASNTQPGQPVQLLVTRRSVCHHHPPDVFPKGLHRLQLTRVIRAVGGRLDDHHPIQIQSLLKRLVVVHPSIGRCYERRGG